MSDKIESVTPDRPLRLGVIGLGGMAQVNHLPILKTMESIELVGFADSEGFKLGRMAEKYGVPGYLDSENLIEKTHPDAVLICTPTIAHLPLALTALQRGIHVIVEKPVTRNYKEVLRLQDAAKKANRQVLVAMTLRFRQDVAVLKNLMRAGELGDVWRVSSSWHKRYDAWHRSPWLEQESISGGGVMMDLGIQLLDGILWLLDFPKPRRVVAFTGNYKLGRSVEDTITATIELEKGALIHLECSWGALSDREIVENVIDGTKASATLNPLVLHRLMHDELVTVKPVKTAKPRELYQASFEAQLHHFVSALRGEVEPISTLDQAVQVMDIVDMIYRSAREGHEILVAES